MNNIELIKLMKALGFNPVATACGGISAGADYDCDSPVVPGVNQRLILGNLDDVESVTYNGTNPSIIEAITMKSNKAGFPFQGIRRPDLDLRLDRLCSRSASEVGNRGFPACGADR